MASPRHRRVPWSSPEGDAERLHAAFLHAAAQHATTPQQIEKLERYIVSDQYSEALAAALREEIRKGVPRMLERLKTRANGKAIMNKGKICGQYVESVLAKRMANKSGFDEALMLDPQCYVAEGTGENSFVVKGDVVRTPPSSGSILKGITRDSAIQLLREQGVEVREEPVARDELYTADEIFLTGTAAEITPVRDIDHRKIGRGEAGPITRRVQEVFFSIVKGTDAKHDSWLTFV